MCTTLLLLLLLTHPRLGLVTERPDGEGQRREPLVHLQNRDDTCVCVCNRFVNAMTEQK